MSDNHDKLRVVVVTNIPTPYRLVLWDELSKLVSLKVLCLGKIERNRSWLVEDRDYLKFLESTHLYFQQRDWALHISWPFRFLSSLHRSKADVIVIGSYDAPQYWQALAYAWLTRTPRVFWNGSTTLSARSEKSWVVSLKGFFLRAFNAHYTYGSLASTYLRQFGIAEHKIIQGTNTVNIDWFKKNSSNTGTALDQPRHLLFVGQLIERKGLQFVLKALAELQQFDWVFTIVGEGPYQAKAQSLCSHWGIESRVIFAGSKQREQLLECYSQADIFIMPSVREVWGLVLNEALACGLFSLASVNAGASHDLIVPHVNGAIVDPENHQELVDAIQQALGKNLDKNVIKSSINCTPAEQANRLNQAIELAFTEEH